jgi:hypothetical protein
VRRSTVLDRRTRDELLVLGKSIAINCEFGRDSARLAAEALQNAIHNASELIAQKTTPAR